MPFSRFFLPQLLKNLALAAFVLTFGCSVGAAQPVPVTTIEGPGPVNLVAHSQILLDPEGRFSADEVAFSELAQRFVPMKKPLGMGFTSDTVWLRLNLRSTQAQEWWLQMAQPVMENITVFERDPAGFWHQQSNYPRSSDIAAGLNTRQPTFSLQLSPTEPRLILLRLQTRTAMVSNMTLWQPKDLQAKETSESFAWGMVTGAYALVIVFYALFAIWTREHVYGWYSTLICINFLAAAFTDRWNFDVGLGLSPEGQVTVLGLVLSLAPTVAFVFITAYARIQDHWPRFVRMFLAVTMCVSAVAFVLVLTDQYRLSALLVQPFSILMVVVNSVMLVALSWAGNKRAQLLLLAFTVFHFSVGWRFMRNIGHIEPTVWNEHAYQIGAFIHMLILSTGIFSGYNSLRRESERQQAKAAAEAQLREQQSNFLGMVAHEVKTPLAVITATSDNLKITPDMPESALQRAEKISRNSQKIQDIFQSYLDHEQVLNKHKALQLREVDLQGMLQSLVQDFQDTHGRTVALDVPAGIKLMADRQLLSIAVNNLLGNAQKYAPTESAIGLQVGFSDGQVEIIVTDNGPGIEADDLSNIFKPYYRGSNSGRQQGSGLGLHLVRYIAEQHQGSASAMLQTGGGMKFVISLPFNPLMLEAADRPQAMLMPGKTV